MSTATVSPSKASSDDHFIVDLLLRQQDLSAVESFSNFHDAADQHPAQAKYYRNLLPTSRPETGQQYAFEVDLDACSGCKACVVACHTLNGLEEEETWRQVGVMEVAAGNNNAKNYHVTTACHHCVDPGCLKGCPVKAYDKDPETGVVRHLDDQCIGCQYCTMMCPYDVPQYSKAKGIVRKCDMCHQRLAVGEAPACVAACPNEAISIKIVDQSAVQTDALSATKTLVPSAPSSSITLPTTNYKSQHGTLESKEPQASPIDRPEHSHWPLAIMMVLSQLSVGLVVFERLLSLIGSIDIATSRLIVTVSATVGVVGIHIALLHLGRPHVAFRAFLGLRTSWMSREIVVFGAYMGLVAAGAGLLWIPEVEGSLPKMTAEAEWFPSLLGSSGLVIGVSAVTGLLGVYCSGMIYVATRRELWRQRRTMTRFFGTLAVLGAGCSGAFVVLEAASLWVGCTLLVASAAGVLTKLNWESKFLLSSAEIIGSQLDQRASVLAHRDLPLLVRLRVFSGFGAIGAIVVALIVLTTSGPTAGFYFASLGVLLITIGEIAERLLYFMSVVYDRMPGALR